LDKATIRFLSKKLHGILGGYPKLARTFYKLRLFIQVMSTVLDVSIDNIRSSLPNSPRICKIESVNMRRTNAFDKKCLWAAQTFFCDVYPGRRNFLVGNCSTPGYRIAALQAGLRGMARLSLALLNCA
jgi:hypothetical protein